MINEKQIEDNPLCPLLNDKTNNLPADSLPETFFLDGKAQRLLEPDAEDILWFSLKKGAIEFKIGLSDILMCLRFAEKQGEIPELPRMWWTRLSGMYPKLNDFWDDGKEGNNDEPI